MIIGIPSICNDRQVEQLFEKFLPSQIHQKILKVLVKQII